MKLKQKITPIFRKQTYLCHTQPFWKHTYLEILAPHASRRLTKCKIHPSLGDMYKKKTWKIVRWCSHFLASSLICSRSAFSVMNWGGRKKEHIVESQGAQITYLGLVVPSYPVYIHAEHALKASLVFCYVQTHCYNKRCSSDMGVCAGCAQPRNFTRTFLAYCKSYLFLCIPQMKIISAATAAKSLRRSRHCQLFLHYPLLAQRCNARLTQIASILPPQKGERNGLKRFHITWKLSKVRGSDSPVFPLCHSYFPAKKGCGILSWLPKIIKKMPQALKRPIKRHWIEFALIWGK